MGAADGCERSRISRAQRQPRPRPHARHALARSYTRLPVIRCEARGPLLTRAVSVAVNCCAQAGKMLLLDGARFRAACPRARSGSTCRCAPAAHSAPFLRLAHLSGSAVAPSTAANVPEPFPLQFIPLYGVVGVASMLMGGIIIKHFSGATDVAFDKKVRMDHNHQVLFPLNTCWPLRHTSDACPLSPPLADHLPEQGGTDKRIEAHNSRLGMYEVNKRPMHIFPFTYVPKAGALPGLSDTRHPPEMPPPHTHRVPFALPRRHHRAAPL